MALPTTISSTALPTRQQFRLGPFISSTGNVYAVLLDTTNTKIHVYKATDPTSSFTEQDSGNIPGQVSAGTLWVIQNGDVLSIAGATDSTAPAYKFHQFSMATD